MRGPFFCDRGSFRKCCATGVESCSAYVARCLRVSFAHQSRTAKARRCGSFRQRNLSRIRNRDAHQFRATGRTIRTRGFSSAKFSRVRKMAWRCTFFRGRFARNAAEPVAAREISRAVLVRKFYLSKTLAYLAAASDECAGSRAIRRFAARLFRPAARRDERSAVARKDAQFLVRNGETEWTNFHRVYARWPAGLLLRACAKLARTFQCAAAFPRAAIFADGLHRAIALPRAVFLSAAAVPHSGLSFWFRFSRKSHRENLRGLCRNHVRRRAGDLLVSTFRDAFDSVKMGANSCA